MKSDSARKFILPFGPILSFTLIGLMLLSALLYYRAIKIQRFLEPALAISQPRMEFSQNIKRLLLKEFGTGGLNGIRFTSSSIFAEESMLFVSAHHAKKSESLILHELSHVFLSALKDENMKAHIYLILIIKRFPPGPNIKFNESMRLAVQYNADLILNSLYKEAPELEKDYNTYFAATAIPADVSGKETNWIEFRIIPSELVHIELLQRLHKYIR